MKTARLIFVLATLSAFAVLAKAAPLEIDFAKSKITVLVDATAHSFTGTLESYDARIECDPEADLPARTDVSFNFLALKTGNPKRDAAMLEWLEYTNQPTASFHLTGWKQNGTTNISLGDLTIHGVKRGIEMPAVVKHEGDTWKISGEACFDHRDFGLPRIRKALLLTVNPQLKVTFHLVGKLSAGK
jgi:polyisoprenoid-binding protein YceI